MASLATPRRITPTEWDSYKDEISTVYLTNNKTLDEVITHMGNTYGFYATKAQYVRKLKQWRLEKNSTKDKWEFAASQVRKRRLEGKETEVIINGRPVPAKRLKKEIARYVGCRASSQKVSGAPVDASYAVTVQTPPAADESIRYAQIPWFQFQDLLDSHHASSWRGTTTRSETYNFTTATGMPLGSSNFVLIPMPSPASEATNQEAKALLGDCLGVEIDPDNPEYVSRISSRLDDIGVQRCGGELVQRAETLSIGSTLPGDMCLSLLRYSIYLASNNLLCISKLDNLLQWVIQSDKFSIVERLIATKMPSVEVFAVKLLLSAARLDNFGVTHALIKRGVDVNGFTIMPWGYKKTALQEAVERRNPALVRLLLDAGANPNTQDKDWKAGPTALRTAITGSSHSLEIAEMLIERGADVNTQTVRYRETWSLLNDAVSDGNIDAVRVLLAAGARVNDARGKTALQIAALRDDIEMVQLLLDSGADVDSPAGTAYVDNCRKAAREGRHAFFRTPLQGAVSENNVKICQALLEAGADANGFPAATYLGQLSFGGRDIYGDDDDDEYDEYGHHYDDYQIDGDCRMCTPLQEAVLQNNLVLVHLLLSLGACVDAVGSLGTALQLAAREPRGCTLAHLLLSKGAHVNSPPAQAPWSKTALQEAALSGNKDMVELLLNHGADVNAAPSRRGGLTALQAAVGPGKIDLVKLLIHAGADVNAKAAPKEGRTCLQSVAAQGDMELLNYLLQLGADPNGPASRHGGSTALQAAVDWNRVAVVGRLLQAGADLRARPSQKDGLQPLCVALSIESYEMARLLLDRGADPNESCDGSSPLSIAADSGAVEMVRCLILAGADVNRRPVGGASALVAAANCRGSAEMISILIDSGAALDGIDGTKALEIAVEKNSVDVVELLLGKGVSPNRPAAAYISRDSALYRAVMRGTINDDVLRLLIDHGANVKADGGSCLQTAARAGSWNAVQILLAAGADVNFPPLGIYHGNTGYTALQAAVLSRDMDLVHILLDAGADINGPPGEAGGETALQAAVGRGDKDIVQFLLSRGADVNGPPSKSYGATALQRAVIDGHLGITLVLLQAGADINAPAAVLGGRTALQAAAEHGRLDLACLLLQNENDTDVEAVRMRCKRAAELASSNGHAVLANILRNWKKPGAPAEDRT